MPFVKSQKLHNYFHRLFGSANTSTEDSDTVVPGPDWHPHFGQIAGESLESWLSGFPADIQPQRSLVLATDERTGSELLCQLLGATGRLGRPSEYLNYGWFQRFLPDYPVDVQTQIAIAHRVGTTPNGCFSMKLHPWHVDRLLLESSISSTFPAPTFVRLTRQDLLSQAISLHRARQTGRFHSHLEEEHPAGFDAEVIDSTMRHLARNRARWDMYFARIGISPLTITYEELCADSFQVVHRIGAAMGETVDRSMLTNFTPVRKQADALSAEWRARYIREYGDIDRLDTCDIAPSDLMKGLPQITTQLIPPEFDGDIDHPTHYCDISSVREEFMTQGPLQDLTQGRANAIADNWYNDPEYYAGAETWVEKLWDKNLEFRPLFDQLDPSNIVELACGHGRNSWQMHDWGNNITLVDIVPDNIEICRKRFEGRKNVNFVTNRGTDFTGMPDEAYSAIFCYDAMVHFDHTVIFAYLADSARILHQGGMALFHHSNFANNPGGDYRTNPSWRNFMPPGLFADYAAKVGLSVVQQKLVSWGNVFGLDALTLVRKI